MTTKMKLHKPTVVREAAAENPPVPRDRLDAASAMRLAMTIEQALEDDREMGPFTFCKYLAYQLGTGDALPSPNGKMRISQPDVALRHYVQRIAGDSHALACFLDWFAQYVQTACHSRQGREPWPDVRRKRAIDHVNNCLRHEAVVFRIEPDKTHGFAIHRIGSEAMQQRVVAPALRLLRNSRMDDAIREYEEALVYWAKGEKDDAIRQASHALETTMKTILSRMGVPHRPDAKPKALIGHIVNDARLIPEKYATFWQNLLETIQGVITVRNAAPGAGHGPEPGAPDPDDATVEYAINMAGANILFLVERWKAVGGVGLPLDEVGE